MVTLQFPQNLELPPDLERPKVQAAAEELTRLYAERQAAGHELGRLERERHEAPDEDRRAYARALRAGKDDPGEPAAVRADAAAKSARRRWQALDEALVAAYTEFSGLVERDREKWQPELEQVEAERRDAFGRAVEELASARANLADVRARLGWLRGFPESRWRPMGYFASLDGLEEQNHEPLRWEALLDVLRRQVEERALIGAARSAAARSRACAPTPATARPPTASRRGACGGSPQEAPWGATRRSRTGWSPMGARAALGVTQRAARARRMPSTTENGPAARKRPGPGNRR